MGKESRVRPFELYKLADAWGTIGGYLGQARTSILEWIHLLPGEELHLECGEDIDRVPDSQVDEESGSARLLEQVKYRERAVSLRSLDVVQAIWSFFHPRRANEGQKLRFRFRTNARIGRQIHRGLPDVSNAGRL
jgi:hypothetical protein